MSAIACSGRADESTTIAFCPPVSAISGIGAPRGSSRSARLAPDRAGDRARAGEDNPARPVIGDQRGADRPVARHELQRAARHPGLVQQPHGRGGDQRRLLGRLGEHGIARRERGGDLPGEDRQREIPRADGDHRAQRAMRVVVEVARDFRRIVAQEVDRFAHFADRGRKGLARLAHDQAQPDSAGAIPEGPRRVAARRARSSGGVACQIEADPCAPTNAASMACGVASMTAPTRSRRSAGLHHVARRSVRIARGKQGRGLPVLAEAGQSGARRASRDAARW